MSETNRDLLWAPWRMAYVTSNESKPVKPICVLEGGDPECFICQAAATEPSNDGDLERLIVGRTESTVTLLNKYPYNNGHLLVTPRRHVSKLEYLTADELNKLTSEVAAWVKIIEEKMNPEGFNVGLNLGRVAGAGLPGHLHWHIVPRWNGDCNFMTTIGSTKAIPQALEAAWSLLRRS